MDLSPAGGTPSGPTATPVTSEDFRNTIERALDPASGSGYAVYLFPIENAEEIYNGEADMDSLGVESRMITR